eukprot:TRINITY_DN73_c0_g1_i1.p1 TRINITY_DN73_c0_g1~~TRINITY_DN73_c0_g1_i1.p1  ORF type:complete len:338 (+),score=89.22 TRINITY_DN73_c0_g1_i1:32-1015(+)
MSTLPRRDHFDLFRNLSALYGNSHFDRSFEIPRELFTLRRDPFFSSFDSPFSTRRRIRPVSPPPQVYRIPITSPHQSKRRLPSPPPEPIVDVEEDERYEEDISKAIRLSLEQEELEKKKREEKKRKKKEKEKEEREKREIEERRREEESKRREEEERKVIDQEYYNQIQEQEIMAERLKSYGFKEKYIEGDGNCQFSALADQLYQNSSQHSFVRSKICHWLRENKDFITESGAHLKDFTSDWTEYCNEMEKDGIWGDHITLLAAANIWKSNIIIISSLVPKKNDGEFSNDIPLICISPKLNAGEIVAYLYLSHWHERHYGSLRMVSN